jgi:hypothetical protein
MPLVSGPQPADDSAPGISIVFRVLGWLEVIAGAILLVALGAEGKDEWGFLALLCCVTSAMFLFGIGFALHRLDLIARRVQHP